MHLHNMFFQAVLFYTLAGTIRCYYVIEQPGSCETLTVILLSFLQKYVKASCPTPPLFTAHTEKAEWIRVKMTAGNKEVKQKLSSDNPIILTRIIILHLLRLDKNKCKHQYKM